MPNRTDKQRLEDKIKDLERKHDNEHNPHKKCHYQAVLNHYYSAYYRTYIEHKDKFDYKEFVKKWRV